mgnify:FL=1
MIFKNGGRKFILAILVWFTSSAIFIFTDKMGDSIYATIIIATLGLYGAANVYQKKVAEGE